MGNFNQDNRFGDRRDFGRRSFDRRGSDRPQMHKAICSNCGKPCEVPFRPTGSKPVFCNDCFRNKGSVQGNGDRNTQQDTRHFDALHAKLDKILSMLTPALTPAAPAQAVHEERIAGEVKTPKIYKETNKVVKKKTSAKKEAPAKTE